MRLALWGFEPCRDVEHDARWRPQSTDRCVAAAARRCEVMLARHFGWSSRLILQLGASRRETDKGAVRKRGHDASIPITARDDRCVGSARHVRGTASLVTMSHVCRRFSPACAGNSLRPMPFDPARTTKLMPNQLVAPLSSSVDAPRSPPAPIKLTNPVWQRSFSRLAIILGT